MDKIKILRLHSSSDNSVVIINSKQVMYVNMTDEDDKKTEIATYDDESARSINESPDKVYEMLKNYGFVKCHRLSDNCVELFNIDYFIAVDEDEDGDTVVYLKNGIEMCVNETPERIYNMIIASLMLYNSIDDKVTVDDKKSRQKANKD